eukprot:1345881-Pyramimonas_sp.AAC.1
MKCVPSRPHPGDQPLLQTGGPGGQYCAPTGLVRSPTPCAGCCERRRLRTHSQLTIAPSRLRRCGE